MIDLRVAHLEIVGGEQKIIFSFTWSDTLKQGLALVIK